MQDDREITSKCIDETKEFIKQAYMTVRGCSMPQVLVEKMHELRPVLQKAPGMIGYNNPDGKRYICKLGRYLNLHSKLKEYGRTEHELKRMADAILEMSTGFIFKECKGEEIVKNYKIAFGSSSCMTGTKEGRPSRIQFYADNPDRIHQITAECGRMQARAMVWILDNGDRFFDRIYSNCNQAYYAMQKYYRENFKPGFSYETYGNLTDEQYQTLYLTGIKYDLDKRMPYRDSFNQNLPSRSDHRLTMLFHHQCKKTLLFMNPDLKDYGPPKPIFHCQYGNCDYRSDNADNFNHIDGWGRICYNCTDDHFSTCGKCGNFVHDDDMEYITLDGDQVDICQNCIEDLYVCENKECTERRLNYDTYSTVSTYYHKLDFYSERTGYFCNTCIDELIKTIDTNTPKIVTVNDIWAPDTATPKETSSGCEK